MSLSTAKLHLEISKSCVILRLIPKYLNTLYYYHCSSLEIFKQEAHGPLHSPEKPVQIPFEQTQILFIQGCFWLSLFEIGQVVLLKKIFKFCQCIFTIS